MKREDAVSAALELEISKARDCLDRAYIQRGRPLGDLRDADLRDAYVCGTLEVAQMPHGLPSAGRRGQ
jgi:hypothetical protein